MPNGVFYIKEEKKIKRQKKLQNLQLTQQGHEEAVRDAQLPAKQPPVRDGRRQRERIADDRDGKVRAHQVQQDDVHRGPKLRGGREGRKICWVLITFGILHRVRTYHISCMDDTGSNMGCILGHIHTDIGENTICA